MTQRRQPQTKIPNVLLHVVGAAGIELFKGWALAPVKPFSDAIQRGAEVAWANKSPFLAVLNHVDERSQALKDGKALEDLDDVTRLPWADLESLPPGDKELVARYVATVGEWPDRDADMNDIADEVTARTAWTERFVSDAVALEYAEGFAAQTRSTVETENAIDGSERTDSGAAAYRALPRSADQFHGLPAGTEFWVKTARNDRDLATLGRYMAAHGRLPTAQRGGMEVVEKAVAEADSRELKATGRVSGVDHGYLVMGGMMSRSTASAEFGCQLAKLASPDTRLRLEDALAAAAWNDCSRYDGKGNERPWKEVGDRKQSAEQVAAYFQLTGDVPTREMSGMSYRDFEQLIGDVQFRLDHGVDRKEALEDLKDALDVSSGSVINTDSDRDVLRQVRNHDQAYVSDMGVDPNGKTSFLVQCVDRRYVEDQYTILSVDRDGADATVFMNREEAHKLWENTHGHPPPLDGPSREAVQDYLRRAEREQNLPIREEAYTTAREAYLEDERLRSRGLEEDGA